MKRLAMMLLAATAILVSACGIDRSESMGTVPIDPPPATSPSTVDPEGSATTTAPPGPTGRSPAVQPARATTTDRNHTDKPASTHNRRQRRRSRDTHLAVRHRNANQDRPEDLRQAGPTTAGPAMTVIAGRAGRH